MGEQQIIEGPKGARKAWLKDAQEAEKRIRYALNEASKRHDRACINNHTAAREHARRLGKTGRIFRELLGARRANGKDILAIGEGGDKDHLYTADTVHRAFSGHFDKHFGQEEKSGTEGPKSTPSSEWMSTRRCTAKRCCRAQPALHNYRGTCEGPCKPSKRKRSTE